MTDKDQQISLMRVIAEQQVEIDRLRAAAGVSERDLSDKFDLLRNDVVNTLRHENRLLLTLLRTQALDDSTISFWHEGQRVRFYVPDADTDLIQRDIVMHKTFYQVENLVAIRDRYNLADAHVIDAGANIGNHSVYFSRICGAAVCHAFEPNPQAYETFKRNAELNALSGVILHKEGLSNSAGMIYFSHQDAGNLGGTRFGQEASGKGVPCRTIDSLELDRVDFIKIDVEGMGHLVLEGAMTTLSNFKPPVLVELFQAERAEAQNTLEKLGYKMVDQIDINDFFFEAA